MTTTQKPARSRARRGEGAALRDEILTAARRLLAEAGSEDAVSLRAVAAAVGVSTPALYLHFADKSALIDAVAQQVFDDLEIQLQAARARSVDPLHALREFGLAYVDFALQNPEEYRIVPMSRLHHGFGSVQGESRAVFAHLVECVQACQQAGVYSSAVSARAIGLSLWAAAHGVAALGVAKPDLISDGAAELVGDVITAAGLGVALQHRLMQLSPDEATGCDALVALLDHAIGPPVG